MKLGGRELSAFLAKPGPDVPGVLLFGNDAMRVALKRQDLVRALIGAEGEGEMRLTRLAPGDLREDPARVMDEMKSVGFFPGPRAVLLEGAADAQAGKIGEALDAWAPGDATVVVTAGQLTAKSALRKLFEGHRAARAAAIYDDPPGREEIERTLKAAGLSGLERDAGAALDALARSLDPGDFRQTVEKIALYKLGDDGPLTAEEVAVLAPDSGETDLDDVLNVVAEAEVARIAPLMSRLEAQGVTPVSLCIAATRHFRTLYAAAADPGGPGQGIARVKPPVFGPRRDRMRRQAQDWGAPKLESALQILTDTDLGLRSAARAPQMAVMERALIRLAMLGRR